MLRFSAQHYPREPGSGELLTNETDTTDPQREELLADLDPASFTVDNTMHCREHSLEAIVPFLQARHRDLDIVPVLAPYMGWDEIDRLSRPSFTTWSLFGSRVGTLV